MSSLPLLISLALTATPGADETLVETRLVAERDAWVPGRTQVLGVHFHVEDHWHLYWKGANDSGMPIQVELDAPEGFTVGELRWPAPERLVWPGDLLDHVYHGAVTLLVPVTAPDDATPGAEVTVTAALRWLVCHESDACIPGDAEVALTLPGVATVEEAGPGDGRAAIEAARARLPGPLPEGVRVTARDGRIRIHAPGAAALTFFPEERCVPLEDVLGTGSADDDELLLRRDETLPGGDRLVGVLELALSDVDAPTYHVVNSGLR